MRLICLLANQYKTFMREDTIYVLSVSQGSAEAFIGEAHKYSVFLIA